MNVHSIYNNKEHLLADNEKHLLCNYGSNITIMMNGELYF